MDWLWIAFALVAGYALLCMVSGEKKRLTDAADAAAKAAEAAAQVPEPIPVVSGHKH